MVKVTNMNCLNVQKASMLSTPIYNMQRVGELSEFMPVYHVTVCVYVCVYVSVWGGGGGRGA